MASIGRVGRVEIGRVLDSSLLGETMQAWFPDFTREAVRPHEHWLCPRHYDPESGHFPMPVQSWLLRIGTSNVLVDTCIGNGKPRPGLPEMHALDTRFLARLAALGVTPADVDVVLCTHLHADHVGWNTRLDSGRWVPTFPNATYVFAAAEYEAAKRDAARSDRPAFARHLFEDSVLPVVEAGKAVLVEGVCELLDALVLRPAPGHTPGHVRIELTSAGQHAVFPGDILHSPVQVPFWNWSTRACWDRDLAARSRRELLDFCVARNALLVPTHFEAPHVGRIRATGDAFAIDFGW